MAYLTKQQSDIWNRYGLLSFAIGLPVLAYSAQRVFNSSSPLAKSGVVIALVAGLVQFNTQALDLARFVWTYDRSQEIASYLRKEYAADPAIKVFCDHPEVRVASGIPREQFYDSSQGGTPKDKAAFIEFVRTNGIKFLVVPWESETSTARQLFPNLTKDPVAVFEDVIPVASDGSFDSLYRVRSEKLSPPG